MKIEQTYSINASLKNVWRAFVNPEYIDAWGGGPTTMEEKADVEFSLWGGQIHGTNLEIIPEEKIVQEWYGGDWEEPSLLTITFTSKPDATVVDIVHKDIPEDEVENIEEGWEESFMEPLIDYVEELESEALDELEEIFFDEEE